MIHLWSYSNLLQMSARKGQDKIRLPVQWEQYTLLTIRVDGYLQWTKWHLWDQFLIDLPLFSYYVIFVSVVSSFSLLTPIILVLSILAYPPEQYSPYSQLQRPYTNDLQISMISPLQVTCSGCLLDIPLDNL